MLRLRRKDGSTEDLEGFIEVTTPDGEVGLLVYEDASGRIHVVKSEDEEAVRYERLFRVKFAPVFQTPT